MVQYLSIGVSIFLMGTLISLWLKLYFIVRDLVGSDPENNLRNIQRKSVEGIAIENNVTELHELIDCVNKENDKILPKQDIEPHWSYKISFFITSVLFFVVIYLAYKDGKVPFAEIQFDDDAREKLLITFVLFCLYTLLYMFSNYRRWVDIKRADRKYGSLKKQRLRVVREEDNDD